MVKNRGLVNRKAISNSLRNDLAEEFEELHKQSQIPKSKLLDLAVELLLKKYEKSDAE